MLATADTAMGGGFRRNTVSKLKLENRCTGSTTDKSSKLFPMNHLKFTSMPRCLSSAPWEEKGSERFQIHPLMFSRWSIISALRLTLCVCLNPLHPEWVILEAFSDRKPIRHGWCVAPGSGGLHRGVGRDYVMDYRPCLCVVCEYLTEVTHLTARRVETLLNTKDELFLIHCDIESCIFLLCFGGCYLRKVGEKTLIEGSLISSGRYLSKTGWKWKKLDRGASLTPPLDPTKLIIISE